MNVDGKYYWSEAGSNFSYKMVKRVTNSELVKNKHILDIYYCAKNPLEKKRDTC